MKDTVGGYPKWREYLLFAIVVFSFAAIFFIPKFGQDPAYHDFADKRAWLGIPNFGDVMSNIPFVIVGLLGLSICLKRRSAIEWTVMFVGITLVSVGSAYYHWSPNNATLVWDRLPMTIGFMSLLVALLVEHIGPGFHRLLIPALLAGITSVFYWFYFDDLRFYAWIQALPLLVIAVLLALLPGRYTHRWLLLGALAFYIAAKLTETYDAKVFALTGSMISGHTIKHLLSAVGIAAIWWMLRVRAVSSEQ